LKVGLSKLPGNLEVIFLIQFGEQVVLIEIIYDLMDCHGPFRTGWLHEKHVLNSIHVSGHGP
jgi:hypothetical protein